MNIKNLVLSITIGIILLTISSCTELGPQITLVETDRVVLIEEFTGVRCVNCPDGSAKIKELLEIHGDKLVAVSIHGGSFGDPFPESNHDFNTVDGSNLIPFLNAPNIEPIGYPSAIINRTWFEGEQDRMLFLNSWAGYIQSELQKEPAARLDISKDYKSDTRELEIEVELFFFEAIDVNTNITVLITEDDIVDVQDSLGGKIYDYKHKHVLRDVISTNYRGDLVGNNIAANTSETINYTYTLPADWNAEKCHIVAFVSKNDGGILDVLQAGQAHVVE